MKLSLFIAGAFFGLCVALLALTKLPWPFAMLSFGTSAVWLHIAQLESKLEKNP